MCCFCSWLHFGVGFGPQLQAFRGSLLAIEAVHPESALRETRERDKRTGAPGLATAGVRRDKERKGIVSILVGSLSFGEGPTKAVARCGAIHLANSAQNSTISRPKVTIQIVPLRPPSGAVWLRSASVIRPHGVVRKSPRTLSNTTNNIIQRAGPTASNPIH